MAPTRRRRQLSRSTELRFVAQLHPDLRTVYWRQSDRLHGYCQHTKCTRETTYDYRVCEQHLLEAHGLVVAQSRIEGAGLGLYAANTRLIPPDHVSDHPPARVSNAVVFQHDAVIGGEEFSFAGEMIDVSEYERRYGDGFGEYVLALDDNMNHDEHFARTALSYANDGVNTRDNLMRRNYMHRHGTHPVFHDPTWPHVINAIACLHPTRNVVRLRALGPICHGDEILWSYSGGNGPSKNGILSSDWVRDANGNISDGYWSGAMHVPSPTSTVIPVEVLTATVDNSTGRVLL